MILKHALNLPNVKRLVYSTCSVHEEENEGVISDVLSDPVISEYYCLIEPLSSWKHRGIGNYSFSKLCLRADSETDLTNGFFVALFERKI